MTSPKHMDGPNQPGRLAATMLRVLAAELSDPSRFARARDYARDGAVVDLEIEPGVVVAGVQGSRYEPYGVTLKVTPSSRDELAAVVPSSGAGLEMIVPDRREISAWCSCPDDPRFCKHALAVLLVLADEVLLEPEILLRWRDGPGNPLPSNVVPLRRAGHAEPPSAGAPRTPSSGRLAELLRVRGPLPATPSFDSLPKAPMSTDDHELATVLADAVRVLSGRWP